MAALDRDLQLFYTMGKDDIGITLLQHKPTSADGYVMLLLAPRAEIAQDQRVPRDIVFVLDTSGSMREDGKLEQAKKALKFGLDPLEARRPLHRAQLCHHGQQLQQHPDESE